MPASEQYLEHATFVTGETLHVDGGRAVDTDARRPAGYMYGPSGGSASS
jgi:hypothetical protein